VLVLEISLNDFLLNGLILHIPSDCATGLTVETVELITDWS